MSTFDLKRVHRRRLSEDVSERLANGIVTGKFAKGERLPTERDLARYLAVSRSAVREALAILCAVGMIEVRHGAGVFVSDGSTEFVAKALRWLVFVEGSSTAELLDTCFGIESSLAEFAAERADEHDIARLTDALDQVTRSRSSNREFAVGMSKFQLILAQAAHCGTLGRLLEATSARVDNRLHQRAVPSPSATNQLLAFRQALVEAIAKRDSLNARLAVRNYYGTLLEQQAIRTGS